MTESQRKYLEGRRAHHLSMAEFHAKGEREHREAVDALDGRRRRAMNTERLKELAREASDLCHEPGTNEVDVIEARLRTAVREALDAAIATVDTFDFGLDSQAGLVTDLRALRAKLTGEANE